MNWQAAIMLQTILTAGSVIVFRVLARDKQTANASFAVNAGMYVTLYISMLVVAVFLGRIHSAALGQYWWRFIAGGLAFTLTNVCTYKTLVYFDAAIASIVATVNALFTVVGASLFLSENLSMQQFVGAVVLLLGIGYGLLATHATRKKAVRRSLRLGITYALLAGISFAAAAVNEKSLLEHMSTGSYMVYGVGGQCIIAVLLGVILQPKYLRLFAKPRVVGWSLLGGALRGFGGACFIVAEVNSNNVGLVSVIMNFRLIVVIVLGAWLLKEHQHLRQKFEAALASIAGVAIMFWK